MNTDEYFHISRVQKECIEHIAGDTIPGIEGSLGKDLQVET